MLQKSIMDNPETLVTLGKRQRTNTNKTKTQPRDTGNIRQKTQDKYKQNKKHNTETLVTLGRRQRTNTNKTKNTTQRHW